MNSELLKVYDKCIVAFVGTRKPSMGQVLSITENASWCGENGYSFTSGGAKGVDSIALDNYIDAADEPQEFIYTPKLAEDWSQENPESYNQYLTIAKACHPNWFALLKKVGKYGEYLMVRNVMVVENADIVLAWPKSLTNYGGTGQAIRVAKYMSKEVEIFDIDGKSTLVGEE